MTHLNDDSGDAYRDLPWVARDSSGGVQRRTIVQGAAWSIPVVAVAAATPSAAASTTVTLEFVDGPYSVEACDSFDALLQLSIDGAPAGAGETVTVTLPEGFTWSDGSTGSRAFVTDASGRVTASGIVAIGENGTSTLSATATTSSGTANATAEVTTSGATSGIAIMNSTGGVSYQLPSLPNGVTADSVQFTINAAGTPVAYATGSDGRIYAYNTTSGAWTGVPGSGSLLSIGEAGNAVAIYVRGDGRIALVDRNGATSWLGGTAANGVLPSGKTVTKVETAVVNGTRVAYATDSDRNLYAYNDSTGSWNLVTTNVVRFSLSKEDSGRAIYVRAGGAVGLAASDGGSSSLSGSLPASVDVRSIETSVRNDGVRVAYALGTNGRLYGWNSQSGAWTVVDTGVTTFSLSQDNNGLAIYAKANGATRFAYSNGDDSPVPSAPVLPNGAHALSVGATTTDTTTRVAWALGSDGVLYTWNDNTLEWRNAGSTVSAWDLSSRSNGQAIRASAETCP